jgi:putative nucleotidyltransferase with HDIG domain
MNEGIRKIDIAQLQPGMYLEDVFNDRGVFLLSANTLISSAAQVDRLKAQGVKNVHINFTKGQDVPSAAPSAVRPQPVAQVSEVAYYQELPRAREIREMAHDTARTMLSSARSGRAFEMDTVRVSSEEVVNSILRNPDALVSLCQIKGYDEYTYVHSVNVCVLMTSLAHGLGYRGDKLKAASMGGLLHDVGKMRVPESILNKPGKYADWEFEAMKKHPLHGADIVKDMDVPELSRLTILQHHERYNGQGYPYGLRGDKIDEVGVIAAVADVYDALTSDRVYRAAWTPQKAIATIFQGCDEEYSRHIAQQFTKHMGIYPVGSFVKLESGEMGVVTRVEAGKLLCPTVLVLFNRAGSRLAEAVEYDLSKKQHGPEGASFKIELSLNPKAYRIDVSKFLDKKTIH